MGTWKVNGSEDTTAIWVEDESGQRVATVRNCDDDLDRANLIAASPELLEFAEEVRRSGDTRLANMAIAIIAKATGSQS